MLLDARLLHQQLQITTRFNDWIQRRIQEFGFEDNQDFYSILSKSVFGRKPTEYHLTMDMAKELAMLERNEVGKRIRQYFIAVEKEARETAGSARLLPKSIHGRQINGRKVYPYRKLAEKLGYSTGGSIYARRQRYPNHFITFDSIIYVSEEMANLMAMNKSVSRHREAIRDMQPLLPLDFGSPIQKLGGHAV
jgi:phage anti-repressor protein